MLETFFVDSLHCNTGYVNSRKKRREGLFLQAGQRHCALPFWIISVVILRTCDVIFRLYFVGFGYSIFPRRRHLKIVSHLYREPLLTAVLRFRKGKPAHGFVKNESLKSFYLFTKPSARAFHWIFEKPSLPAVPITASRTLSVRDSVSLFVFVLRS